MNEKVKDFFRSLVSLSDYVDLEGASASIRKNIYFKGPTVFILACAIIIASVGLNVNSIPVIIGAMLISPVMAPILGFGFSLGVQDMQLLKDSLRNFAVMVVISILASAIYFLLSPLNLEHPTELLARTNPTIYDVLIALFGGFAGILENSRKEKGTVLSGVAIATALMPPLCTVGYGISIGNLSYILGAFYLFMINSIFIALATFVAVKYLKYPVVQEVEGRRTRLTGRAVSVILLLIIVPSVLSAIRIVQESNFKIHASRIVEDNKSIGRGFIYDYSVDNTSNPPSVVLYMAGEKLTTADKERLYEDAEKYGITRSQIVFREDAVNSSETVSESEIVRSLLEHSDKQVERLNQTIAKLRDSIAVLNARLGRLDKEKPDSLKAAGL
ncbi:MAG: DUF389 domain-containing protein [Bacteroidales bacterium]|nr:DUF389 domain-containing protein [Bacteroidales bacterium]MBR0292653.1 DUF389 domain-containing protein [Bacteroidales bacterium]